MTGNQVVGSPKLDTAAREEFGVNRTERAARLTMAAVCEQARVMLFILT